VAAGFGIDCSTSDATEWYDGASSRVTGGGSMMTDVLVEFRFARPLSDRQAMAMIFVAGTYRGVEVLVNRRQKVVGLRGQRWALDAIRADAATGRG
jgi:hypothetical protein